MSLLYDIGHIGLVSDFRNNRGVPSKDILAGQPFYFSGTYASGYYRITQIYRQLQ